MPRHETETAFFKHFHETFPHASILLVDTYDAYGPHTGIPAAVKASQGQLAGIRLDSRISAENIRRARAMLDELGAPHAKIVVSGGMDEHSIAELGNAPVDAFGVGERIVTSPDAPVGVGAVGKLCEVNGKPSMKLSTGSGKATLPGRVQVYRENGIDTVARLGETLPGCPRSRPCGRPMGRFPCRLRRLSGPMPRIPLQLYRPIFRHHAKSMSDLPGIYDLITTHEEGA